MPLTTIRAQIKTLLESVPNVGMVHDYERWTNDPATVISFFQSVTNGPLNGWVFKHVRIEEFALTNEENLRIYTFQFRGIYSVVDANATEKTFSDVIETIVAAFRKISNDTLNGTAETLRPEQGGLSGRAGLQVDRLDFLKLAGVICHYAELSLGVQERLDIPD